MANWAKLQEDLTGLKVVKRAKHGIHFQNNDGSVTANFSGKPCHYLDGGIWKPIDTKLAALGDGYYGCPHSKVKIKPDGTVAVAGTDYAQRVELPSAKTGLLDGDKLIRKFAFGEQRMWVTEDGFRSEIQLNRIPTLTEAKKLIASESGTLSKEYLKSLTTAEDAKGDVHTVTTLSAFRTWLASAVFPVVIDPDFVASTADAFIYGQDADYATARSTSGAENATGSTIKVGQTTTYQVYRGYFSFNTSTIGAGSTVTQVNLKLTVETNDTTADFVPLVAKYNWSSGTREQRYDGCLAADLDDGNFGSTGTGTWTANTQKTSGDLSTAWVSKTGTTYYGNISDEDRNNSAPAATELIEWHSASASTESYRPVLTVTYTAASTAFVNILDHTNSVILGGSIVR